MRLSGVLGFGELGKLEGLWRVKWSERFAFWGCGFGTQKRDEGFREVFGSEILMGLCVNLSDLIWVGERLNDAFKMLM